MRPYWKLIQIGFVVCCRVRVLRKFTNIVSIALECKLTNNTCMHSVSTDLRCHFIFITNDSAYHLTHGINTFIRCYTGNSSRCVHWRFWVYGFYCIISKKFGTEWLTLLVSQIIADFLSTGWGIKNIRLIKCPARS